MFGDWMATTGQERGAWEFWTPSAFAEGGGTRCAVVAASSELIVTSRAVNEREVRFISGWGFPEAWGRFANRSAAEVDLAALSAGDTLSFDVATIAAMSDSQNLIVEFDGRPQGVFTIYGPEWQWRTIEVPIPSRPGIVGDSRDLAVAFRFARQWVIGDGDERIVSAPIRNIATRATARRDAPSSS